MADGSIRVKTQIDNSEIPGDIGEFEKMCDNAKEHLEKIVADLGVQVKPVSILNNGDLTKAKKRLEEITAEVERIQAETDKMLPEAATDEQVLNLLKMEESETKNLVAEQEELNRAITEYEEKLAAASAEKQRQINATNAEKQARQAEKEHSAAVKGVNADVGGTMAADDFMSKIHSAEQYEKELARVQERMRAIEVETSRIAAEKGIDATEALEANKEYQKLKKQLSALTTETRKFKKESKSSFAEAKKGAAQLGDGIKSGIKQMLKFTLAIFGARSAFFAVKNAIRQVLADNEELNRTVTAMKGVFANAIAPYVERLVYYISYALAYLNLFIKTLTGVDLVANYNAKALKKQADATKEVAKAAKDAKNQLAGFDEKNILTAPTTTDSGADTSAVEAAAATLDLPDVSGGKFEEICETIKAHIAELEVALGVAMISVGFILLACGQIPMGIACILAGIAIEAAALGGWEELSKSAQDMITAILIIAGTAFLAIGIILCATGANVALGVTMIAIGAAELVTAIALNWTFLTDNIESVVAIIATVVGGALLVIGAILAFTSPAHIPLAIALMAAGAATLIATVAVSWDALPDKVKTTIAIITAVVSAALLVIGIMLAFTWTNMPLAIALVAAGAAGLIASVVLMWDTLPDKVKNTVSIITAIASAALLVLGIILCVTGANLPLGVALIIAGVAGLVTVAALNKDVIKDWVSSAWTSVKNFWNSSIKPIFTAKWWTDKLKAIADGAKNAINTAISYVEKGINWMVGKINTLSFDVPDWVPGIGGSRVGFNLNYVNLPRLQTGAIVNNPGKGVPVVAGEAGAEAILPLNRNIDWMYELADIINSRRGVPIVRVYLKDGRELYTDVKVEEQDFIFATNGGVL